MRVNPPPFCVLDEIEAALDDVNVALFAQYLRRMSLNSQFITITHRRGTMEGSDMLYGDVYKRQVHGQRKGQAGGRHGLQRFEKDEERVGLQRVRRRPRCV